MINDNLLYSFVSRLEFYREEEEEEEYKERIDSQLAAREEDDPEKVKEASRRRRQAILEKYKQQQQEEQPNQQAMEVDINKPTEVNAGELFNEIKISRPIRFGIKIVIHSIHPGVVVLVLFISVDCCHLFFAL